jgi:hypothetical protein
MERKRRKIQILKIERKRLERERKILKMGKTMYSKNSKGRE